MFMISLLEQEAGIGLYNEMQKKFEVVSNREAGNDVICFELSELSLTRQPKERWCLRFFFAINKNKLMT